MQITPTTSEGLKREFKVVIPAADIEERLNTRLRALAKDLRLPGFRPGKVPVSVVKQRYGKSLMGEVLEQTVNDSSTAAVQTHQLRPALRPKVEIESFDEGADLVFAMSVEVLPDVPEVALDDIELERLVPEVADSEVDDAITKLAERHRKTEEAPQGTVAATGDIVVIDAVGSIDGEKFPGGEVKDQQLELGSGRFIPGFEDQLVGAVAGEHRAVNVSFPEDYPAEHLRGKAAVFEVDVKSLLHKLPAAIDDALAGELGLENLAALRDAVREQIAREYGDVARQKLKRDLLDRLAERYSFEVPPGMVDLEFEGIWQQYQEERARLKAAGSAEAPAPEEDEAAVEAEYRAIAERRVRLGLVLAEIGRLAGIDVTPDELNRAVAAEARRFPRQAKEVFDYYRNHPEATNTLRAPILEEKVVDHIVTKAKVTDVSLPPAELLSRASMEEDAEATPSPEEARPADEAEPVATPKRRSRKKTAE